MRAAPLVLAALLASCGAPPSPVPPSTAPAGAVVASVPIGRGPTLLAIAPDGAVVYAASMGTMVAIRTASDTIIATVPIDPYTTGIAVTPDGTRVLSIATSASNLRVLDAPALAGGVRIALPQDLYPGGYGRIAVTADGGRAFVVNERLWLASVDLAAGTSQRVPLDLRPRDVAVSRDGRTVFVAGCKAYCTTGTIEPIDTGSGNARSAIDVGPAPYRLALSPDGRRAYTTNLGGPTLSVVDLSGATPVGTLPVGTEPTGLAVSPDGAQVYVAAHQSRTLVVARGDGSAVVATVPLDGMPRDVVASPDGRRVYVSTSAPNRVVVLDATLLAGTR